MKKLSGVLALLLTPWTKDYKLDEATLRRNINKNIELGVHGIIVTGSVGEFHTMTNEERREIFKITVDEVNGRVPVIAGTGGVNTAEAIKMTKASEDIGCEYAMVIQPYYWPITMDEVVQFYKDIDAEVEKIRIMVYNNPGCSQINITAPVYRKLKEIDSVVAAKETTKNFEQLLNTIEACGDKIAVFPMDYMLFPAYWFGAKGCTSVIVQIEPKTVLGLWNALEKSDIERGKELFLRIIDCYSGFGDPELTDAKKRGIAFLKEQLNMVGITEVGLPRKPFYPLLEDHRKTLEKHLIRLGLIK